MSTGLQGFAYRLRDPDSGHEMLCMMTFGTSKGKAKLSLNTFQNRRMNDRKPKLEVMNVCAVTVTITEGQPPVDNRFVAEGCEQFKAAP